MNDEDLSLDDVLSETYDSLEAPEPEAVEDPETPEAEEQPEPADKPEEEPEGDLEGKSEKTPKEDELEPEYANAPRSWTPEAKARYAELSSWAKREVHKREKDMEAGVEKLRGMAETSQRLEKQIAPFRQFLQANNIPLDAAVVESLQMAYNLRNGTPQQRGQILKRLAQSYGADLDVEVDKKSQIVEPLQREIQTLKQQIQSLGTQGQQASQAEVSKQIQEFETAVDDSGELSHPYFANVQDMMADFINSGRATTLQDAYDKAVWADPQIRSLLQAQQRKQEDEKRQAEAKARADKLKQANKASVDKRGGHDTPAAANSMDDTLSQLYDELVGQN